MSKLKPENERKNDIPFYAYLNNAWALFSQDGVKYSRDEMERGKAADGTKLSIDRVTEVHYPKSCSGCGTAWRPNVQCCANPVIEYEFVEAQQQQQQ
jgi:hypothetical protein